MNLRYAGTNYISSDLVFALLSDLKRALKEAGHDEQEIAARPIVRRAEEALSLPSECLLRLDNPKAD